MARKMTDDEIMDYTYNKLFGDLDNIEAGSMFDDENPGQEVTENAKPEGISGISLTITPLMAAADNGKHSEPVSAKEGDEEDEADNLKGISKYSNIMEKLHGER